MNNKILVGTVGYPVAKKTVWRALDFVELLAGAVTPPRPKVGRSERSKMGEEFGCTVVVPAAVHTRPTADGPLPGAISEYGDFRITEHNRALWQRTVHYAQAVSARALVLPTPPAITPSMASAEKMAAFFSEVETPVPVIWDPRGPWTPAQKRAVAQRCGLVVAHDPFEEETPASSSDLAYFRVTAFSGMGTKMGTYALEQLASALQECGAPEVWCALGTQSAFIDARNLKRVLEQGGEGA